MIRKWIQRKLGRARYRATIAFKGGAVTTLEVTSMKVQWQGDRVTSLEWKTNVASLLYISLSDVSFVSTVQI